MSQSATEHVAAEVRAELGRQGHDRAWLAAQLGVSEMWVSRRLRNLTEFSVNDLAKVAKTLGVPTAVLMPREAAPVAA